MSGSSLGPVRIAGNTEKTLENLFRREYEPMHRLAFTLLRSDTEAEEVVQDAFVAIASRLDSIGNHGGYLRTTVVNGARRRLSLRLAWQPPRVAFDEQVGVGGTVCQVSPEYLVDLVDELPDRERVAVVLRYYACWNATEIGEVLECPAGTVRSMLHRSLGQLRRMLSDD